MSCTIIMKFMSTHLKTTKNKTPATKLAQHIVQHNKNHPIITNLIHARSIKKGNQTCKADDKMFELVKIVSSVKFVDFFLYT